MMILLALGTTLLVLASALMLTQLGIHSAEDPPSGFAESLWIALTHVLDPGTVSRDQGWAFRSLMLVVTLGGIFSLSCLISILSSGLQDRLDELKRGKSAVVEDGHIVILGWSPKIFIILNELILANSSRFDNCIVVLAEREKLEMEDELRAKVMERRSTRIVCRSGNPTDPSDLERVNPYAARAIIVLAPESSHPDAECLKTVLALTKDRDREGHELAYHIVVELRESEHLHLARIVGKDRVELVVADDLVARMIVQATRQLGLSIVYSELMDFEGGEIYFHSAPVLEGTSYAEAILRFENSAVMGLQKASGEVTVNPDPDTHVEPGDRVVLLAEDDSKIVVSSLVPPPAASPPPGLATVPARPERVLILGWNEKAPIILRELDRYLPKGSALTVVSSYDVGPLFDEQLPMLRHLTGEYWTSPTSDRMVLEGLDLGQFHHILVLAYRNHLDPQECDAQTLMTLLQLRDICDRLGLKPGLLSEMLDLRNRELAEVTNADDFIVSDRLVSMVISQVTENRAVMRVFEDLFRREGSEIYLMPCEYYALPGSPTNFYDICRAASARHETAIGYRRQSQRRDASQGYGLHMNPKKSETLILEAGDEVVVVALTEKMLSK